MGPMRSPEPALYRAGFFRAAWLAVVLAASSGAAVAQVHATGEYLQRMDTDRDGLVSLAEYQDWMSYAFTRMDRDGNGELSADELPGGRGKPVSLAAHRQALADVFVRQDRNRDGALDARELAAPPR